MSTKIYNGYRVNISKVEDLITFCQKAKTALRKARDKEIAKYFVSKRLYSLDRQAVRPEYQKLSYRDICKKLEEAKLENNKGVRNFEIEMTASAVFIPRGRAFLVYFCCDNQEMTKAWQALEEVEDYHYQDQCDRPEELTSREWNKRKKDWDEALGPDWVPANHGLTFEFSQFETWGLLQTIKEHYADAQPSHASRIKHITMDEAYTYWVKEFAPDTRNFAYSEWREWSETEDGKKKIKEIEENVRTIIKDYASADELFQEN